jgi:hypothetical protein
MEEQPNSCMCFVWGLDNLIGLHLKFWTDGEGRCIALFRPSQNTRAFQGNRTRGPSARCSMSKRKPLHSVAFSLYDAVRLKLGETRSRKPSAGKAGAFSEDDTY